MVGRPQPGEPSVRRPNKIKNARNIAFDNDKKRCCGRPVGPSKSKPGVRRRITESKKIIRKPILNNKTTRYFCRKCGQFHSINTTIGKAHK